MDDRAAIETCRAGGREAFRHLVERYQAQAAGHAIAILGNRDDALDAIQEAFLDAWRALPRFEPERRFYPWFYTILRNCCYKLLAARGRRQAVPLEPQILAAPPDHAEEAIALEEALLSLEPEDRELLTLKHLDGLACEELAERFRIPLGTVLSRLFHARRRLRNALASHKERS